MAGRNYEVVIEIGGSMNQSLAAALNRTRNNVGNLGSTIKKVAAIAGAGIGLDKIKDFTQDCVKESRSLEAAMANVAKVVEGMKDDNGRATESYHEMEDSIINMSKTMPMLKEDIAAIVASAGQANIPKEDLERFAKDAAKMGIAFDSTADQAGEWMAAWRTAFDMSQEEVVTLADKINYLGNTSSEDAIKLSEVVTNIGSLGKIANLGAEDIAAMGAAMTKVNSSIASTGIKNVIKAMTSGMSATKRQADGFHSLGLSAKNVADAMQMDSQGTILDVLDRIKNLKPSEQSAAISNIFGNESKAAIAPLIANLDNLKEQFGKVGDAAQYAGSMEQEYYAASSTSENLNTLTSNKYAAMQKEIGDELVPIADEMNRTKGQLFDLVSDFVEVNSPAISESIQKVVGGIQREFPTALYTIKDFASGLGESLEPAGKILGGITEHMDLLAGVLTGAFAAKKGYSIAIGIGKTAQSIRELASAGGSAEGPFNIIASFIKHPWALGFGAAAAGLVGVATAVKVANEEAKKENLAEHFGDISLSLQDLQSVAKGMVQSGSMEQLAESMSSMQRVDELAGYINDSANTLNRLNWKVSVGLELNETDRSEYIQSIDQYINDTQELLDQKQYSVSMNLDIFASGKTGKKIKKDFAKFYTENSNKLHKLGKKLNKTVTEAFNDDLLTIDEAEKIQKIQEQMAEITEQVAGNEFRAELKVMEMDNSGKDLTADSFKNLMSEANSQKDETLESLKTSFAQTIADTEQLYGQGSDEYKEAVKNYQLDYLNEKSQMNQTVAQFAITTMQDTYGKEIGNLGDLQDKIRESLQQGIEEIQSGSANIADLWTPEHMSEILGANELSKSTKDALKELWSSLAPQLEEMEALRQEYWEIGKDVPEELAKGIMDIGAIGAMVGNQEAMFAALGAATNNSEEYQAALKKLKKAGYYIPEELNKGIEKNKNATDQGIHSLFDQTKQNINYAFAKGMKVTMPVTVNPVFNNGKPTGPYSNESIEKQQEENRKNAGNYTKNPVVKKSMQKGEYLTGHI